ncbi:MAG: allophanate hydrolase [Aeromicrobium sp.]|nr:allophanate hydrolase [Aeromicrobium sp.]
MIVRPYGDRAVLLDCESLAEAHGWFAALEDHAEVVLGARTVLVRGDPATVRALVQRTVPAPFTGSRGQTIEIPVTYDGADLRHVAGLTGLSSGDVVAAHVGTAWTVAFGGFAPGFFYLAGGDPRLTVPRLPSPRTHVPAGAVGLAGEFSGIYPRASPGGWQLIGRTSAAMWSSARARPALLTPGMTVRFVIA